MGIHQAGILETLSRSVMPTKAYFGVVFGG